MVNNSLRNLSQAPDDYLQQECEAQRALFEAQPPMVQRFLEAQSRQLAEALIQRPPQVRFTLPDRVTIVGEGETHFLPVPAESREQIVGSLFDRLTRVNIDHAVRQRLAELSQLPNRAIATSADLIRYATATHMVHNMLPAGRSVTYVPVEGEEVPTLPVAGALEPESAITAATDAIAEEGQADADADAGRGQLQVPYTPAARRFYLPQWVAFDDQDHLLVNSTGEAEAHLGSMQRFVTILHAAVSLTPYIVGDEDYQRKRYGMLGQLINQGRALARFQAREIIQTIKQRAAAHDLNRGLSLSLPYFDDQTLQMKTRDFQIIPAGRIMFVPAFVVRAAREEQAKAAQDTRLNPSTRKHLMAELKMLEEAFV